MSKFSKLGRRGAAAVAVAAAAVIGATSMGAGHAEAQKLAPGYKYVTGLDGEKVELWRKDETGLKVGNPSNNPLARDMLLSGTFTAKGSSGVGGNLSVGYIIGCQVDISGITVGFGGGLNISAPVVSFNGGISIPIKPGQVAILGSITDKDLSDKGVASIQLSNLLVQLPACGGYAAARSWATVTAAKGYSPKDGTLNGSGTYMQSTLYGQPFSIQ